MTTQLSKFTGAYATMTVAVYEPLIVKWYSVWTILNAAETMAFRIQRAKHITMDRTLPTAAALKVGRIRPALHSEPVESPVVTPQPGPYAIEPEGGPIDRANIGSVDIRGFPDAVVVGAKLFPHGLFDLSDKLRMEKGNPPLGPRTIPVVVSSALGAVDPDFDFTKVRKQLFSQMVEAIKATVGDDSLQNKSISQALHSALKLKEFGTAFNFWPMKQMEEELSPIGIAHFYRQHYLNAEEGVGPIEEAFTVAPLETLEVVYETVRRQIHEEEMETGSETVSDTAIEVKNLDEVSDKVSYMIQNDTSASMSASTSGSIGVWSGSASADISISASRERSGEQSTRQLKEMTKRASERITKSFRIKTRDVEEFTTTNLSRRVIKNESNQPVSFGLRRVLRKVQVKVQDLGPRLVWQLYVPDPGVGLVRSNFVSFASGKPVPAPDLPPGLRPQPKGGTETGTTSIVITPDDPTWKDSANKLGTITIGLDPGPDRIIRNMMLDSITNLEGDRDETPVPIKNVGEAVPADPPDPTKAQFAFRVRIGRTLSWTLSNLNQPCV